MHCCLKNLWSFSCVFFLSGWSGYTHVKEITVFGYLYPNTWRQLFHSVVQASNYLQRTVNFHIIYSLMEEKGIHHPIHKSLLLLLLLLKISNYHLLPSYKFFHVLFLLSLNPKYFPMFLVISPLTNVLFLVSYLISKYFRLS